MISTPIGGTHLESGGGAAGGTPPTATRAWVCCHPIPGDLLPIALHCGIAYECTDPLSGNQTICVCSANPVGLLKDMPGRNVRNRDCDSWWPWHGAWGPIVPYCGPMDSDHPDYWLWKGSPALAIGAQPILSNDPRLHPVQIVDCPAWQECMHAITDALFTCCVHYELLGDHGPNSNSFACLLLQKCLCQTDATGIEIHELTNPTLAGAEGCDFDWVGQFCGPQSDENCAALCPLLE